MSKSFSTRRQFLQTSAAATAVGTIPYIFTSKAADAVEPKSKNDRPRIAGIGLGGQGSKDLQDAAKLGDVVAVCDVDLKHAERAKAKHGGKAVVYQDYRNLLEREDVDVVINGTPDHWHTAVCIAACKAGADVYTEKPMTLTIDEGKILSKVVKETGRCVQVGTQQRSDAGFQTAVELVRNGRIGKLEQVRVTLPFYTVTGGPFSVQSVPENIDWDLYQGQAPEHPYCVQRTHSNFRWWYEYAGGITTDWGNHHMDIAHWGMDCELTGPTSIEARGIFPNEPNEQSYNTADRFFSRMMYPNGVELLYFVAMDERARYGQVGEHQETSPEKLDWLFGKEASDEIRKCKRNGIMFIGDQGRIFVNRGGVYGKAVDELKDNPLPENAWRVRSSDDHMANLFECMKTRKEPVSPVRIQHRSITACHLTNISLRLGRKITWDPKSEQIIGDAEANAMLKREQRTGYEIKA